MIATAFAEENAVLDSPKGVDPDDCGPLSVWRGPDEDGDALVVSCWKVTADELEEIKRTGRVWLMVWGRTMVPTAVCGQSPFEKDWGRG